MAVSEEILKLFENSEVIQIKETMELSDFSGFNSGVYYIRKGAVKTFKRCGKESFILNIHFAGEIIGLESAFSVSDSDKYHVALKNTELGFVPVDELTMSASRNKKLFSEVLHYISEKSDKLELRILNITSKSVTNNLAELLLLLSKLNISNIIPGVMTTSDIANLVGTTTSYVYKTIQKLENKSIVSFKERKLRIVNMELLKRLANANALSAC